MEAQNQNQKDGQPKLEKKRVLKRGFTQVTPLICAFCGGKSCKHENWLTHPGSAIKGLNSDWITHNILATQRPSSRIIAEYNIIEQFKAKEIGAILNLQEPGEHPHCGDGINPQSGFSYCPEEFYEYGIYFFNFGWRDMTATSTDIILKILKQMSFILLNGQKIAIHCHAGRGRTGMIIAAWLIYNENMTAKDAIKLVKMKRKDAISKKSQEEILYKLEKEIKQLRSIFFLSQKLGLDQFLYNQKRILPLSSVSEEKFVPKIILAVLERMESLLVSNVCDANQIAYAFYSLCETSCFSEKWEAKHEKNIKLYKERMNLGNYQLSDIDDPRYAAQILLDFLDSFASPAVGHRFTEAIFSKFNDNTKLTDDAKEQLHKEVDKKEFFVLESLARFFSVVIEADQTAVGPVQQAISRVCISLLLEKNKLDKLFVKRNLIKPPLNHERVQLITTFVYKWIETFSDGLSDLLPVCGVNSNITSKKPGKRAIAQLSRTKTLLMKAIEKNRVPESPEHLSTTNPVKTKIQAEDKANYSTDTSSRSSDSKSRNVKFGISSPMSSFKADTPYASQPIKEDLNDSLNEEDIFPSSTRSGYRGNTPKEIHASRIKPLNFGNVTERDNAPRKLVDLVTRSGQNTARGHHPSSVDVSSEYEAKPKSLVNLPRIKPLSVQFTSSKLDSMISTFEQMDQVDQGLLLGRLLQIHAERQKYMLS